MPRMKILGSYHQGYGVRVGSGIKKAATWATRKRSLCAAAPRLVVHLARKSQFVMITRVCRDLYFHVHTIKQEPCQHIGHVGDRPSVIRMRRYMVMHV